MASRPATAWTTIAIVVAVTLLALFNAQSPRDWTAGLPPGPVSLSLRSAAERWWTLAEHLGLNSPREGVSGLWGRAKEARWPTREPEASPPSRPRQR